jgi:hypothetical protein
MKLKHVLPFIVMLHSLKSYSQDKDTVVNYDGKVVTLSPVVIRSGTDVKAFIKRIEEDTSFYKAFKNLRILNYTSFTDIRMLDRKGNEKASFECRSRQWASSSCRVTEFLEEKSGGDYYTSNGELNYYTAELYSSLFFSKDTVCGESNIIGQWKNALADKKGIEKHKAQLKTLLFNPGANISGIPLIGRKVQVFDPAHADNYNFSVDILEYKGSPTYVFKLKVKDDLSFFGDDDVVIDEMTTYLDYNSFEVLAKNYKMSYNAGVYKFNVMMEVELGKQGNLLYPTVVRYQGEWGLLIRRSERGLFTTTFSNISL